MAFAAPSTCRVHPLPRVQGGVRCTSEATRGGAHKGKHDRVPCRSRWIGRCSNGWRQRVQASGAGTASAPLATRFRERPATNAGGVTNKGLRTRFQRAATSGVTASPIQGSGLRRQVTTATPFAPRRSWPSGAAIGSRQWTPACDPRQHGALANGPDSGCFRVALNGGEVRLHFRIDCRGCFAPGLDMDGLGLWFGAGSLVGDGLERGRALHAPGICACSVSRVALTGTTASSGWVPRRKASRQRDPSDPPDALECQG